MHESYPLQWPQGQPRTPLDRREERNSWKKQEGQSIIQLEQEMRRFGVLTWTITRKDPRDIRTAPDPSVAVLFSRKHDDDYSWQHALGVTNPAPTVDEIEVAFKRLALVHHPDRGGDPEMFSVLTQHKRNAIMFVNRLSGAAHEFVICCDKFSQARWNILAVAHTIHSFRQMERDGTSRILEQALAGFRPALTEGRDVVAAGA